ncbi:MAG: hypothetical protein FD138_3469 [Planctomycetota bacterium]|nr:MAG: hypothetical protein FD138_3469 [Planctomycetota bacterium]
MSGFGALLILTGFAIQLLADAAWTSQRVRMALPLPVESSPIWLIVIGLVCEAVGGLMMAL